MIEMKWLEEILEDVEGKDKLIKDIKTNLAKEFVPKSEFNSKIQEVKDLKEQVEDRDTQLEDLKKTADGNEELVGKIEELEEENKKVKEDYENRLTGLKKKQIASKILLDNKAKDVDVNLALFNLDEFELNEDGDELVGFEDTLKEHKEEYGFLYEEQSSQRNYGGFKPLDGADEGDDNSGSSIGSMFAEARNKKSEPKTKSLWD